MSPQERKNVNERALLEALGQTIMGVEIGSADAKVTLDNGTELTFSPFNFGPQHGGTCGLRIERRSRDA
jgi:hypothetical protein